MDSWSFRPNSKVILRARVFASGSMIDGSRRPLSRHEQDQFLDVTDRDDAERRWHDIIKPRVLSAERIPLAEALGRVLAHDVPSLIDVPSFDRSNLDGYALRAEDTFGAAEETPRSF